MKIAIMMRAMDQDTGFRVYVERLVETMVEMDQENGYLLLYNTSKWFGRFSQHQNVKELLVEAPHKLLWDQVVVPYKAWREGADVIFNPKFSVPLISHCPVTMGLQEPAWWAWPEHHTWLDVRYMKAMLPLYCRKSAHLFPMSQFILDENRRYLKLSLVDTTVTYSSHNLHFRLIQDTAALTAFRKRYRLPEQFILSVTRVENLGNNATSFCGTKNVETTVRSYLMVAKQIPHKLVIAGRRVREYLLYAGWSEIDLEGIHFTDHIPHEDIPLMYSSADIFIIPSFYEGCPHTLIEAMACGCPIIASEAGPCPEIRGGAAILADPYDSSDFAAKILMVAENESLKRELREKSLKRAKFFNWERTARLTLEGLARSVQLSSR